MIGSLSVFANLVLWVVVVVACYTALVQGVQWWNRRRDPVITELIRHPIVRYETFDREVLNRERGPIREESVVLVHDPLWRRRRPWAPDPDGTGSEPIGYVSQVRGDRHP